MAHPCCGSEDRLLTGVKIIAWLYMILTGIATGILILCCLGIAFVALAGSTEKDEMMKELAMGLPFLSLIVILLLLLCAFFFLIAYRLLQGAKEENVAKCQTWRTVSLIFLGLDILWILIYFIQLVSNDSVFDAAMLPTTVGGFIENVLSILPSIYFIWVVSAFISRLRQTQNQTGFVAFKV